MGGRTVEIKFDVFTIEKGEKKMGRRTVEIKFHIFTIEKGEKKMGGRMVEMKNSKLLLQNKEKKRWLFRRTVEMKAKKGKKKILLPQ